MNSSDKKTESQNRNNTSGFQPAGQSKPGGAAPAPAGRPAAPAGQTPGYRPQQGGAAPARPGGAAPASPAGRPGGAPTPAAGGEQRNAPASAEARGGNAAGAKGNKRILTVGNDILLKGEIATCDRLVIEGMVDATLKDVHTVEISETGSFKGNAEIQDAEISGLFEGDLIVRNRLTIYATGRVRGNISYGEIEIERGGQMTGTIKLGGADSKSEAKDKDSKSSDSSGKKEAA